MTFNTINFLLFLAVVSMVYYWIPSRFKWAWILLSSMVFYISFVPVFILLFAILILINYTAAIAISRSEKPRRLFIVSLIFNIALLAFFKYSGFFISSFQWIPTEFKTIQAGENAMKWVIPLGLSYMIFTIISYLAEVKKGTILPERHLGIFAGYLLFFPKIAQGPIERPQALLPQFHRLKNADYYDVKEGIKLMLWGFFKKLVVADRLDAYVTSTFENPASHNGTTFIIASLFYAVQIYADFSGYTDIALGSARLMGFNLSNNFNRPYFSTSIREFWNRWHITLSTWLRDYLFLPLAFFFSKKLKKNRYLFISTDKWIYLFSIMITFAICGLWHGEGLNFLVWGLIFGFYLTFANWTASLSKEMRKRLHISKNSTVYKLVNIPVTFILLLFTFIFFRASDLPVAGSIIVKIFTEHGYFFTGAGEELFYSILAIMLLFLFEFKAEVVPDRFLLFRNPKRILRYTCYILLIGYIGFFGVFDGGNFIYFQF